jgi:hypothetical protein
MIAPPRPKLWTALLLLICGLTSAPLGSMEQAGQVVLASASRGPSVPVARAGSDVDGVPPVAHSPAARHLDGAASARSVRAFHLASNFLAALPSTVPPREFVPGTLSRLPYHATAPPS